MFSLNRFNFKLKTKTTSFQGKKPSFSEGKSFESQASYSDKQSQGFHASVQSSHRLFDNDFETKPLTLVTSVVHSLLNQKRREKELRYKE